MTRAIIDTEKARIMGGGAKTQTHLCNAAILAQQVFMKRFTKSRQGINQTIGRNVEFPSTNAARKGPFERSMDK